MLDKMGGIYAPRPTPGGHSLRECLPLVLLLRNRLKYALTAKEVLTILKQRLVKVDGHIRTNPKYPTGFNDVVSFDKTNEHFRLLFDTKGRFTIHPISEKEAQFKLCKVTKRGTGPNDVPFIQTNDGRLIRYPDPLIRVNDTVKVNLQSGRITKFVHFETGNLAMITGGHNQGRLGEIINREKHPGSFEIIHLRDVSGHVFTTRLTNVFVVGKGHTSLITLPPGKGIKLNVIEERKRIIRLNKKAAKAGIRNKKKKN